MNALLAVGAQLVMSGSNFLVFILLSRLLTAEEFAGFATAVGLNMLAFALAEAGISYVAPQTLADRSREGNGRVAGGFIAICCALYIAAVGLGYGAWNALSKDDLQPVWVAAYSVYFAPGLLVPSWATFWAMDRLAFVVFIGSRAAMVAAAWLLPAPAGLAVGGLVFSVVLAWLLPHLNRSADVVRWPHTGDLRTAAARVRTVLAARSMSYLAYSSLPMMISAISGNTAASDFVAGERIKALYSVIFQPIVQTAYLRQFLNSTMNEGTLRLVLQGGNLAVCLVGMLALHFGIAHLLGANIARVVELPVYIVAAAVAVATSIVLYLDVLPRGQSQVFHWAAMVQLVTFAVLLLLLRFAGLLSPAWVLLLGEVSFFLAVTVQTLRAVSEPIKRTERNRVG